MKHLKTIFFIGILFTMLVSCKNKTKDGEVKEDILVGKVGVLVDESVYPVIRESADVFESSYTNASLDLISLPEVELLKKMYADSLRVMVTTRKLNGNEEKFFASRGIKPRVFEIGKDAVIFIVNNTQKDSLLTLNNVKNFLTGDASGQKLIFDNSNSSTLRFLKDFYKLEKISPNTVSAMKNSQEVLDYIAAGHPGTGVIGLNWYLKAIEKDAKILDKIRTLKVQNSTGENKDDKYYDATQSNMASGLYPFERPVYILNYQPNVGLGMGFSAFLTGDRGQRIFLKAGLLPEQIPGREINIKEESSLN